MQHLGPEKALIFRITHIDNVPWILGNGLHCKNSKNCDATFIDIGNKELIDKRSTRLVDIHPGGTLSDYVPFYFTPLSPMLLNIKSGWNGVTQRPMSDIVIFVAYLRQLADIGVKAIFTDRHAYLRAARYSDDLTDLNRVDWKILCNRDFQRDPNDPGKMERYQAEALVYRHMPVEALAGVVCHGAPQAKRVKEALHAAGVNMKVVVNRDWFF